VTSTTIRTPLHWQPVKLYADLFRYRDLFLNLFRRELRVKYRGSILGLGWTLINPIALMLGYWLLFSILLRVQIENFPLFVLSGLVTWIFFQGTLQMACTSLLGYASLVKQVRFPRQLLPLSVVASNLVTAGAMLGVALTLNLIVVPESRTTFWAALPLLVPLVAFVAGFAIVLSCVTVRFRDVEHLLTTIFLPWFVLTPIFYTLDSKTLPGIDSHPHVANALYYGNVIAPFVEAIRDPLFFGQWPRATDVVYMIVAAVVALVVAALVFRRVDDQLAAQL
jgi:lipopolysaccharide transport system permease protein